MITCDIIEKQAVDLFEQWFEPERHTTDEDVDLLIMLVCGRIVVLWSPPNYYGGWPFDVGKYAERYLKSYWKKKKHS